jgi:hypothetical protein
MKTKASYSTILLVPALMIFTAFFLNCARGPYWLGENQDPDYSYLLNSLNFATHENIYHTDHPGTPVQFLGAMILKGVHATIRFSGESLQYDVIANPEYYLTSMQVVMAGLNVLMVLFVGMTTFFYTKNLWLGLLIQLSPFCSYTVLFESFARVAPEPLLLFCTLIFMLLMVVIASSDKSRTPFSGIITRFVKRRNGANKIEAINDIILSVLFGVITGLGISAKITFFPLVIIPLIILNKLRHKFIYGLCSAGALIICTLPIKQHYLKIFDWFVRLIIHSGIYGQGEANIIDPHTYLSNLKSIIIQGPIFSSVLIISLIILIWSVLSPSIRKIAFENAPFKVLFAVVMVQAFSIIMVAKHWTIDRHRYLLPALSMSALLLLLIFRYLKKNILKVKFSHRGTAYIPGIVMVILCLLITKNVNHVYFDLRQKKEKSMNIYLAAQNEFKDYAKIYYYRSSSPLYALKFGNEFSGNVHSKLLKKMYPNAYFYNIWSKKYSDFEKEITLAEILQKHNRKVLYQGTRREGMEKMKLQDIYHGQPETLYVLPSKAVE